MIHLLVRVGDRAFGVVRGPDDQRIRFWDIAKTYSRLAAVEKSIYSAEYRRLCGLLRDLRHEAGLTQVAVAERLGVPQSFVSKYESGERRLDVIELGHVARALDSSLEALLRRLG